ncbi:hypothetical protein PC115_g24075, partial [Phytophthora cactorum]
MTSWLPLSSADRNHVEKQTPK